MLTIKDLVVLLPEIMSTGEVPMLVGHAGIGKTEALKQIAKQHNKKLVILSLSQMEPGDLIGMPARDEENKKTVWLKPEWWPEDGNTIIFLDEINRSQGYIRSAVMQLLIDKRLHTHELPQGTWLCAAMNPESEDYDVDSIMDKAFIDRFVWLAVTNDFDDWKEYAAGFAKNRFAKLYLGALEQAVKSKPSAFKISKAFELPEILPTPRANLRLVRLLNKLSMDMIEKYGYDLFVGILGKEHGDLMYRLLKSAATSLTAEAFFNHPDAVQEATAEARAVTLNMLPDYMVSKREFSDTELENFVKSLSVLSKEELGILIRAMQTNERFAKLIMQLAKRKPALNEMLINEIADEADVNDLVDKLISS